MFFFLVCLFLQVDAFVTVHQVVSWLDNIYFCMWDHQLCEHSSEIVPRQTAQALHKLLCFLRWAWGSISTVCEHLSWGSDNKWWLKWYSKYRYNRIFQCKFCYCTYSSMGIIADAPKRFVVVLCVYMYSRDQCNW